MRTLARTSAALSLLTLAVAADVSAQHPWSGLSADVQIRLAVQAAPEAMREAAAVQGWDATGAFVTLREGSNGLVCMAPNPASPQFEVSCHHEGLEPFFARGRELAAEGVEGQERLRRRWQEYEAGTLPIPYGGVNHILTGTGFDAVTGTVEGAYLRWVIYTPMATGASTGITEQPVAGGPWLMFPGTAGSHIMISPPRGGGR